jgi:methionine aminopeptidase
MVYKKTDAELKLMAEAGRRLARVINELTAMVKPGITTNDIDARAQSASSRRSSATS